MKRFFSSAWQALAGMAGVLLLTSPAQAQTTQLVIDQAAVLPSIATPGSGTIWDLHEYTDAQGNTYQAVSFSGTVHFGSSSFTSPGAVGVSPDYEVAVAKRNAAGVYQWAVAGGGLGSQRAVALAVDATGNVVVTGSFDSPTATFGTTTLTNRRPVNRYTRDIFVLKVGAGGWQWAVSAGGGDYISGDDYGTAVAVDALGGVYVAGTYTSSVAFFGPSIQLPTADLLQGGRATIFVAKLGATGTWQWARRNEYYSGSAFGLVTDALTNVYLAAEFGGLAQFGPFIVRGGRSADEVAVAKLDNTGSWQWVANSRSSNYTGAYGGSLQLGNQGELYLTGTFIGDTITLGSIRLFNRGIMVQIPMTSPYYHTDDAYLARLDAATGRWRWATQSHGDGYEYIGMPLPVGNTALYVGVNTYEPTFQYTPSAPGHQFGTTNITTAGGTDIIIAQLDTAGTWQWARQAGGPSDESAAPSFVDGQGRVVVAGTFAGPTLPLSSATLPAAPTAFAFGNTNYTRSAFTAVLGANGPLAATTPRPARAWTVYPNPARTAITIAGLPPGQPVRMLDLLGRLVLRGTVPKQGELYLALPAGLPIGLYLVRAGAQTQRLVVE